MAEDNKEQEERDLWQKLTKQAELDTALAGVEAMAALTAAFYKKLVDDGVPAEVAAELANSFIYTQMNRSSNG